MYRAIIIIVSFCLLIPSLSAQPVPGEAIASRREESPRFTVFQDVNLVPMTSETVVPHQTVIVENNRVVRIGAAGKIKIPRDATVIDGSGKYLMPGLADMHAHYISSYDRDTFFNLFLKNGVTTVRLYQSIPNDPVLSWRDDIKSQKLLGPTLYTCGLLFNDPVIPADTIVTTKRNYDFIKLYSFLSEPEFRAIMQTAKKEHIYTIGHVPFLVGLDGVIAEGMKEIAHITELDFDLVSYPKSEPLRNQLLGIVYNNWVRDFYSLPGKEAFLSKNEKIIDAIVTKVKNAGLFINTTLIVDWMINEQLFEKEKFLKRPELQYMMKSFMPEYLAGKNRYRLMLNALMEKNKDLAKGDNGSKFFDMYLEVNKQLTKKLHDAGVLLLLGTDTPAITVAVVPGYSIHQELQILTGCGLTPYEAIKTGTANAGIAAKAMTGINNIGTIEINKQADFILTTKNPLQNVANIKEMVGIMVQGRWLAKTDLDSLKIDVKANLADALAEVIFNNGGTEAAITKYNEIKAGSTGDYPIIPEPLNILGNNLLETGKLDEAIAVFKINVQEFPGSWNGYISLAEAYLQAGNKALAIENYEKSLKLNPTNKNAQDALTQLRK